MLLTKPQGDPPKAIMVHVTTFVEGLCEDNTLILDAGVHPFIVHKSYVWFSQGGLIDVAPLVTAIERECAEFGQRCSLELLTEIRKGFLRCPEVSKRLKKLLTAAISEEGKT